MPPRGRNGLRFFPYTEKLSRRIPIDEPDGQGHRHDVPIERAQWHFARFRYALAAWRPLR